MENQRTQNVNNQLMIAERVYRNLIYPMNIMKPAADSTRIVINGLIVGELMTQTCRSWKYLSEKSIPRAKNS